MSIAEWISQYESGDATYHPMGQAPEPSDPWPSRFRQRPKRRPPAERIQRRAKRRQRGRT